MENFRDVNATIANKTISKETAVTLYGTEKQQGHFKKYKRFTNTKVEDALIKTLLENFDTVEILKDKRPAQYKIGNVLEEVRKRIDNRGRNNESAHTKYLDAIVLMALSTGMFNEHETTMNKWVYNFGLVNEILYKLKTSPFGQDSIDYKKSVVQDGVIKNSNGKKELTFFLKDYDSHKKTLQSILEKMDEDNLINFYKVPKVKLVKPIQAGQPDKSGFIPEVDVITIDSSSEKAITEKQAELREKYDLSSFELMFPPKNNAEKQERIKNYYEEENKFFKEDCVGIVGAPIEYFWFNRAISVKATETRIKNYLKSRRPEFYELYIEDKELFLSSTQENYTVERNNKLLKYAYDEIDKSLNEFIDSYKDISPISKNRGVFNDEDIRKIESFWRLDCAENVRNLIVDLAPDHKIGDKR